MKVLENEQVYIRNIKAKHILTLDKIIELQNNPIIRAGLDSLDITSIDDKQVKVKRKTKSDREIEIIDSHEMVKYVKGQKQVKKLTEVEYNFALDNSLETEKLFDEYADEFLVVGYEENKGISSTEYITDIFVNVDFSCCKNIRFLNSKKNESDFKILDSLVIREYLYEYGFKIGHKKYFPYKRSSNKSRGGSCLFIEKSYYGEMIEWSHIGIKIPSNKSIPLDKLRSYESLTMSGIVATLKIKRDEILMINDYFTKSNHFVGVYGKDNDFSCVNREVREIECNLWDGQCLISDKLIDTSTALLRERWFKSNAIATNFEEYFKSVEGGITELVDDYTGEKISVSKLKLIITPSSLKWLSLADTLFNGSKEDCYRHWKENLIGTFGICKFDKGNEQEQYNLMNYQYLSSLNLNVEQLKELLKGYEYPKINSLKNDLTAFKEYVSLDNSSPTRMMIKEFGKINGFESSQLFREFRNKTIESYMNRLKKGRIGVDGKWLTLVGNVAEMLEYTWNKDVECKMGADECYTTGLLSGEVAIFRSPHILSSNCLVLNNVHHEGDDNPYKWFRFNKLNESVLVLNTWETLQAEILNNADFDSDFGYCTNNKIITSEASKYFSNTDYPVPISGFDFEPKQRNYTAFDMADLDDSICNNCIGDIVNLSAFIQATYFDRLNNKSDEAELKEIFEDLIKLSILSQLEIDRAKKSVDSTQIAQTLECLKKKYKGKDGEVAEPLFAEFVKRVKLIPELDDEGVEVTKDYKYIKDGNEVKVKEVQKVTNVRRFDCTMDNLLDAIKDVPRKIQDRKQFDLLKVLPKPNTSNISYRKLECIKGEMVKLAKVTKRLNADNSIDEKELKKIKRSLMKKCESEIPKDLSYNDMLRLIRMCLGQGVENELYQHRQTILGLLFKVYPSSFKSIINKAVKDNLPQMGKVEISTVTN